ncbi:polysaccharide pyruvyl transferase family protein [Demequina sp. NBRC 110055]|uniref:polysaccharide pyruvyl transferase family protein n=1 Tax=Demequina sp. NBRC 110055 TaxID=1570344 RepID=UPI000A0492BD|nr:polysaccharide pyruvyl transferase family protein [Demequina sp. NBRC 110055]
MNVVVIGDIGWKYLYHLGDEAMTEAAIDMLRERGVDGITLIAGDADVASAFYGLPAVPRLGFNGRWSRDGNAGHLRTVDATLAAGEFTRGTVYTAVRDADAVVIAGGGNMNAAHSHHLYERVALTRVAAHFGTPLYVTSQTVGPTLTDDDRAMVAEIAAYATSFGAREAMTHALVSGLAEDPSRVVHTLDDAAVLRADAPAREAVESFGLPDRYVAASFSNGPGTTFPDAATYYRAMARLCDELVRRHDIDVVLAPHAGSFSPERTTRDQDSNRAIVDYSTSGRVAALPLLTARQDVALVERATLSLSTRYHPAVFAPAVGTPAGCIAPSYYSSVRMRGAMRNVGLERYVLSTESLDLAAEAFGELIENAGAVRAHLAGVRHVALDYQGRWWDAIVDSMRGKPWVSPGQLPRAAVYIPDGAWSAANEASFPLYDGYTEQIERAAMWESEARRFAPAHAQVPELLSEARAARRYRRRKSVRMADAVGRFRERLAGSPVKSTSP